MAQKSIKSALALLNPAGSASNGKENSGAAANTPNKAARALLTPAKVRRTRTHATKRGRVVFRRRT